MPSAVMVSLANTVVARDAAALACAMLSPIALGAWASPQTKIPSVAKSTGRSFTWASKKKLSAFKGTL